MTPKMIKLTFVPKNKFKRREVEREVNKIFEILFIAESMFYEQLFQDNGISYDILYSHYLCNFKLSCTYIENTIKTKYLEVNEKFFTELLKP